MSANRLQKAVLWWLIDQGGSGLYVTGHKTVTTGTRRSDGKPAVLGNENGAAGLLDNGWVTTDGNRFGKGLHTFTITEAGRKAAGRQRIKIGETA